MRASLPELVIFTCVATMGVFFDVSRPVKSLRRGALAESLILSLFHRQDISVLFLYYFGYLIERANVRS
jgi:hypothetical protein